MADNTTLNVGTGGDVIASDDISGVKHQRVKVEFGADGSASDVSSTNPLPIGAGVVARSTLAWTSATSNDTTFSLAITGYATVILTLRAGTTLTSGAIIFEISDDGINWYPIFGRREGAIVSEKSYTLLASDTQSWSFAVSGWTNIRIRLNPAITGTGTLNLALSASAVPDASTPGTSERCATATLTNVAASASNVTLLAANPNRIGAIVFNDSTAIAYIKYGTTASTSSYTVQLAANGYWEMPKPFYTGELDVISSVASGNLRITELT